jgi:hypothetical protein
MVNRRTQPTRANEENAILYWSAAAAEAVESVLELFDIFKPF